MNRFVRFHLTGAIAGGLSVIVAGHCARSQHSDLVIIDSARVANAAFDAGEASAQAQFGVLADSLRAAFDTAQARYGRDTVTTNQRRGGVRTVVQRTMELVPDTGAQRLLAALGDSLDGVDAALAGERLHAAKTLSEALNRVQADSVELARRAGAIDSLQRQRNAGLEREAALARRLRGWRLAVAVGPGGSFDGRLRGAPIQVTIGLSRDLHLPRLMPHF